MAGMTRAPRQHSAPDRGGAPQRGGQGQGGPGMQQPGMQGQGKPDGSPRWMRFLQGTQGNSAVIEAISGRRMAEEEASAALEQDAEQDLDAQGAEAGAQADAQAAENDGQGKKTPKRPTGTLGPVWDQHKTRTVDLRQKLSPGLQHELKSFKAHYEKHKARYEKIGKEAGVPAALVGAIHWRECSGDFTKYLHQGDPLGKPARRVPKNIPLFHDFDKAAVHALKMKSGIRDAVGLDENTRDPTAVATYAEAYNGLGYHNRGKSSPYVYSGTEEYTRGKYVKDGVFSSRTVDQQIGVLAMMGSVGGLDGMSVDPSKKGEERTPSEAWDRMRKQGKLLKRGEKSEAVRYLQQLLKAAGQKLGIDGDFGRGTAGAVSRFQKANGIHPSGEVDRSTADALEKFRDAITADEKDEKKA